MNIFEMIYDDSTDAKIAKMKSDLIIMLTSNLREKFKTRKQMCEHLGVSTSEVSKIMNGQLSGMSFEKILKHLIKLELNVDTHLSIEFNHPIKCEMFIE